MKIHFIPECQIGRYSIDFAILEQRIAIEADGDFWHTDPRKDARRDSFLKKHGWATIRIKEFEVNNTINLDQLILDRLKEITNS